MVDLEAQNVPSECRLCGKDDESLQDIIGKPQDGDDGDGSIVERLHELLHIKVTPSDSRSKKICRQCLEKVNGFNDFMQNVQAHDLRHRMVRPTSENATVHLRPGLNDNPGEFILEEGALLYHIDPFEEISSDDDFSESDSEAGEEALEHRMDAEPAEKLPPAEVSGLNEPGGYPVTPQSVAVDPHPHVGAPKQSFLCQHCDMAFTVHSECMQHERNHDTLNPLACGICPWRTANRQSLIFHIKEIHRIERPYICKLCNKGFCRRSDLKKHTIVHTGVRPYSCHVCAKSFSRNTNLKKHIRIHSSLKPHVCQQCPRSFTTYGELLSHARTHSTPKSYQCSQCPATFARNDKLQLHAQNHRQDAANPSSSHFYQREERQESTASLVNQVPASFVGDPYRNSILAAQLQQRPAASKSAMPKQTNSRSITCNICFKVFTRERDLQRHQALHFDKLLSCKHCGQEFSRREKLVRHEQEQHAPKYPCNICRIVFYNEEALNDHLKVHQLQQSTEATMASGSALSSAVSHNFPGLLPPPPPPLRPGPMSLGIPRPSQADLSFYSQLVPTMNLGFYSETRPENNGY